MQLAGPTTPARVAAQPAPAPAPVSLADARAQLRAADDPIEAAAAARAIREASFRPSRAAVEEALEGGRVLDRERGRYGGINGRIKWTEVDGDGVTGHDVHAIVKRVHEQGAAEQFTWELAKTLGLHSYFPAVGRRPSGSAYQQRVSGREPGWDVSLVGTAKRWYEQHVPGLSDGAATAAARTDIQLLHFVDYLIANSDRRGPNIIVDEEKGTVNWIDSGLVGMGDHPKVQGAAKHRLAPELQVTALFEPDVPPSQWPKGDRAFFELDRPALEVIRTRLTPERLAELHQLLRDPRDRRTLTQTRDDDYKTRNNHAMLDWISSDTFLDHLQARRAAALRNGGFHYTPFSS